MMVALRRIACLVVTVLMLVSSVAAAQTPRPLFLQMATGSPGASFFQLGAGIAEAVKRRLPGSNVMVLPGGGISNPQTLNEGNVQMTMGFGSSSQAAYEGRDPYPGPLTDIRSVARLYDQYYQIFIRQDSPVSSFKEIVEQKYPLRLVAGPKGFSGEAITRAILAEYGITYEDIESWGGRIYHVNLTDGANLVRDGIAEAITSFASINPPYVQDLYASRPMQLLTIGREAVDNIARAQSMFAAALPVGTYPGQTEEFYTLGDPVILLVRPELPDDWVYVLTQLLNEEKETLMLALPDYVQYSLETAPMAGDFVPLHPGAAAYYRDQGLLE